MRRGLACLAVAAFLTLCAAVPASAAAAAKPAAGGRTYVYGVWNMMGGANTQYNELIKKIVNLLFSKMNEKVKIVEMSQQEAYAAVRSKKVDFTTLFQSDYVDMLNKGYEVHPVITVSPLGRANESKCIVVTKGTSYSKPADLKGKRLATEQNQGNYVSIRWFFAQKGVDMPMGKFFGRVMLVKNDAAALAALNAGKVDAGIVTRTSLNFQRFANSGVLSKLREAECFELPWPSSPVVWVGKPDPKAIRKLYDVLGRIESYPEFAQMMPLLKTLKLRLTFVTEKDFAALMKISREGSKKGWVKEYNNL
jgi:ABC-type phosphate/phosphonate transport system substrate-binding protein